MCHNHLKSNHSNDFCHNAHGCSCKHNTDEAKLEKSRIIKLIAAFSIFIFAFIFNDFRIFLILCAYFLISTEIIREALKNLVNRRFLDENFLMTVASLGAISIGEYPEAFMVMLLYQIGELFQSFAVQKSKKSISDLLDIVPVYANLEKERKIIKIKPENLKIGDIIVVQPGEKIPADGTIIEGQASINTSNLTGESIPKSVIPGDRAISGCINLDGLLKIKVEAQYQNSTVSKILEMVEKASSRKAKAEKFITKFAKYYTPFVVIFAILLAVIAPFVFQGGFIPWFKRALIFLVISCPCALVISVPLSFFGGIGAASRKGILIKGSNFIETLSNTGIAAFDKTGTITTGEFEVTEICPFNNFSKEDLLKYAAYADYFSLHPIALCVKKAYSKEFDTSKISNLSEKAGKGVFAKIFDKNIVVGNFDMLKSFDIKGFKPYQNMSNDYLTVVYIAIDFEYAGYILISDVIKPNAQAALEKLRKESKIDDIIMLTGDNSKSANFIKQNLKIDKIFTNLLPNEKVEKIEEIMQSKKSPKSLVFIGDGINDAPVLSLADVGIAMGAIGSTAAIEAADVVIMDDDLEKINHAILISKKTMKIVKQNIFFALSVKFLFLTLGAMGLISMWGAVFADVGVTIIAVLNALKILYFKA